MVDLCRLDKLLMTKFETFHSTLEYECAGLQRAAGVWRGAASVPVRAAAAAPAGPSGRSRCCSAPGCSESWRRDAPLGLWGPLTSPRTCALPSSRGRTPPKDAHENSTDLDFSVRQQSDLMGGANTDGRELGTELLPLCELAVR